MSEESNEIQIKIDVVQRCERYFANLDISRLLTIHFVICSAGLLVVATFLAGLLANTIHLPVHLVSNLYPWAQQTAGTSKIVSLLQYVVAVMAMFIYYPFVLLLSKKLRASGDIERNNQFPRVWLFFLILIAVNAGLLFANKDRSALVGELTLLWMLLFLWFPLSVSRNKWLTTPRWLADRSQWLLGIVISLTSVQYAAIFIPLISSPVLIGHDYVNVSAKTILSSGKVVDNLDYINEHRIDGLQLYDPRKSTAGTMVKVEDCPKLYRSLENIDKDNAKKFYCDAKGRSLTVKSPFVLLEDDKSVGSHKEQATEEEKDFIRRNSEEQLKNQQKRGWLLYHHGYNFGPMSALSLGASPEKQTMVYGWLSTETQGKILESLGMANYQGYFKVFFSTYIIYYAIFLLTIWLIYKDLATVSFASLLAISAILMLGIELIKLAPGFNPVRHFFDVPAFYLLYRYLLDKKKAYLFASAALSVFAILWSKDMGLFLTISVAGALIVYGVQQRPFLRMPLVAGTITAVMGLLLYFYPMPGSNPTAIYMLLGVGSPSIEPRQIFNMILVVGVLMLATILIKQNKTYKILTVGMALYFVQGLTYYIWYPETHHIWGMAPVFILWIVALYHGWVSQHQDEDRTPHRQVLTVVALLLLVYGPGVVHFNHEKKTYRQQFENHQLYQWTFERASFASTMDPSLFEEAVKLIKQYSPDNGIYIISKYDHILPILAGRYSAMPYNELLTNLVSPKEADAAAGVILDHAPQYLFVDSDIGNSFISNAKLDGTANFNTEPAAVQAQKYYSEAIARERLLEQLNEVYKRVADKYEKCKAGGLVSVYCRKSS
jgi:hypothetical protein